MNARVPDLTDVTTSIGSNQITAGDRANSLVYQKIAGTAPRGGIMPPAGAMDPEIVERVGLWIDGL